MMIKRVEADGYKNLKGIDIAPCEGINVIFGDNAQGKTNLLEAVGLFSGKWSLRNSKEGEPIGFFRDFAVLKAQIDDGCGYDLEGEIVLGVKNRFRLNKVELLSIHEFSRHIKSVAFCPDDLKIVDGVSENRRKFLDLAIYGLRSDYITYLRRYNKALRQKNKLLKDGGQEFEFDVYDEQLAKLGTIITILREDYVKNLKNPCEEIYEGISKSKERLEVFYKSTIFEEDIGKKYEREVIRLYFDKLKQCRAEDKVKKFTSVGVHRDDLQIMLDGQKVRDYGSRGQRRSCVIALKLGEVKVLAQLKGIKPIILLDDIMSELDANRQDYILNNIKGNQVFISCCDISNTLKLKSGGVFHIKKGEIEKVRTVKKI